MKWFLTALAAVGVGTVVVPGALAFERESFGIRFERNSSINERINRECASDRLVREAQSRQERQDRFDQCVGSRGGYREPSSGESRSGGERSTPRESKGGRI
jgi:hypothetical protein